VLPRIDSKKAQSVDVRQVDETHPVA